MRRHVRFDNSLYGRPKLAPIRGGQAFFAITEECCVIVLADFQEPVQE